MKEKFLLFFIPKLVSSLIYLIGMTCRAKLKGVEHIESLNSKDQKWIYSVWHGNTIMGLFFLRGKNVVSMVSQSKDGEYISKVANSFGYELARGSSSKGGRTALIQMLKALRQGKNGILTPDGPRGPLHELKPGIISMASKSGLPLVPWNFESNNQWVFEKSWDKHKLPKPFSTIYIHIGEPFYVEGNLTEDEFEKARSGFESKMLENDQRTIEFMEDSLKK